MLLLIILHLQGYAFVPFLITSSGGYQIMGIVVIMVMKLESCVKGTSQIHWMLSQFLFVKCKTEDKVCCLQCNLCKKSWCCLTNVWLLKLYFGVTVYRTSVWAACAWHNRWCTKATLFPFSFESDFELCCYEALLFWHSHDVTIITPTYNDSIQCICLSTTIYINKEWGEDLQQYDIQERSQTEIKLMLPDSCF